MEVRNSYGYTEPMLFALPIICIIGRQYSCLNKDYKRVCPDNIFVCAGVFALPDSTITKHTGPTTGGTVTHWVMPNHIQP